MTSGGPYQREGNEQPQRPGQGHTGGTMGATWAAHMTGHTTGVLPQHMTPTQAPQQHSHKPAAAGTRT